MNKNRISLINQAFSKLDKNSDGKIDITDLKGVYSVQKHPKFLNGEWSEDQILRKFLDTFDTKGKEDGIVNGIFYIYLVKNRYKFKLYNFFF